MSGPFFDLPDAALEADIATVAQKGGGKTYTNKRLVERLLSKGRRVCVLDPLNNWWGLQGRADGTPGYPILIIGGPNADVPLDPSKGVQLAAFVARSDVSTVVDVSDLRKSDLIRFATEFLNELYRINRDPLWLVLEEADVFAPQNPSADGSRAMHDAADQIARRGRQRGFRLWTITQRPARLSKDLLTQASTLILLRIRGPQDRNAAADWVKGHAETEQAKEVVDSLASLKVGEGWVYSPDFDLVKRVRFPPIETLDTSRTPQAGDKARKGTKLAKPDVQALRALMTDAGAEPPAPQAQVVHGVAEAEVRRREKAAHADGVKVGFADGEAKGRAKALAIWEAVSAALGKFDLPPATPGKAPLAAETPPAAPAVRETPAPAPSAPRRATPAREPGELSEGALTTLQAARQAHREVNWAEASLLAGKMPNSGYQRGVIAELKANGFTEPPSNDLASEGPMISPADLRQRMIDGFAGKGPARTFFEVIWDRGPITRGEVCEALGASPISGYTRTGWKALSGNARVVETAAGFDLAPILREASRDTRPVLS